MPTTSSSGTLRKFIPQPNHYVERYGNFTLTSRDLEILEAVHRYRYLEARHIRALVGGSNQQLTRRLQGLFHNRYLGRYARRERMRLELDNGAPLIAYGLELNGARTLKRNRQCLAIADGSTPAPVAWKKSYTRRTDWFLDHSLMIANFRCVLELAAREAPNLQLIQWLQGDAARVRFNQPGKVRQTVRVSPDAYFALRQAGQVRHIFLEADRSTEEHRRLIQKFTAYWWYLQSSEFRRAHRDGSRVTVLFITTGPDRMSNLIAALRDMPKPNRASHGGRGLFWFGLESDYSIEDPSTIFTEWLRSAAGHDRLCRLL